MSFVQGVTTGLEYKYLEARIKIQSMLQQALAATHGP